MGATVRADDSSGWAWEWLPLQAWIAWIVILVALALIPLPIVGRIDIAWWRMRRRAQLTVFGWRQATNVSDAAADSDRDSATWTLVTACLLVAVPAAKFLPVDAATRQLVIVIGLAVAVAVRYGRQFPQAALSWQLANPRGTGAPGTLGSSGPLGRLALGAASLAVCVAAGVLIISEADDGAVFVALWMAMIPLVILLMWEIHRHDDWARHREISGDPPPDRAVLWTVGPAVTMFVAILMVGWMVRDGFDPDLVNATIDSTGDRLWFDDGTGRAISTLVVIGLGEEYVFRGLLFALAMTTPLRKFGFLAVSVSFALWHLDDAWGSTAEVLVVLAAAFMASHLALVPLRLRSRGLAGPVLLHTAVSSSILLVL
jgi:membrane protease YdiL (CAAX protease family)